MPALLVWLNKKTINNIAGQDMHTEVLQHNAHKFKGVVKK